MNSIVVSGVIAGLGFIAGGFLGKYFYNHLLKSLVQKKEEELNAVKNTPAVDLVNAADNADKLHADAAGIAGKFRESLRNKVGAILSGRHGDPADGDGGSGT